MKKLQFLTGKRLVYIGAFLVSTAIMVGCDKDDEDDPIENATYVISGSADGQQINPPVEGTGSATFNGSYDSLNKRLIFTSNWSNLSGPPTYASFYTGESGTIEDTLGQAWLLDPSVTASGSFTDTLTLTSEQMDQLLDGNWFYMYNTAANVEGEISGQLTATRQ
jgi:hypothetical protein